MHIRFPFDLHNKLISLLRWELSVKRAKTLILVGKAAALRDRYIQLTHTPTFFLQVFLDAPHVLTPVDLAELNASSSNSSLEDLGAAEATEEKDPALAPRGWWKVDATRTQTHGLEDSLALLRDVLAKDHYDVCWSGIAHSCPSINYLWHCDY